MTLESLDDLLDLLDARLAQAGTPAAAVPAQRSSAAIGLFVDGLSTLPGLQDDLRALGYDGERARRLVESAVMDRARRLAQLAADVAIAEMRAGLLTPGLLRSRLIDAGFSEQFAVLVARLEELRLPEAPAKRSTIGLILPIPPEARVEEAARRRSSIGLALGIPEAAQVEKLPAKRSTIGLILPFPPGSQVLDVARRRSSIGLELVISPIAAAQDLRARRTAIGLRLELAGAQVAEAPEKRPSSIGLVLAGVQAAEVI